MLYNEKKEKKIPGVDFTFYDEGKSKEEIQKEINELIKKRDEIYAKIIKEVKDNENVVKSNITNNDYPRRIK